MTTDALRWRPWSLDHADPAHRPHVAQLYEAWERANRRWYDSALACPVVLVEPLSPRVQARTAFAAEHGITVLRFSPEHVVNPWRVADALVHETIHQWLFEVDGRPGTHHDLAFAVQANRIGRALAVPVVLWNDQRALQTWPRRPAGYYERSAA